MNDLIARTFVVMILLAYTAVFLALILAIIRRWHREHAKHHPSGESDAPSDVPRLGEQHRKIRHLRLLGHRFPGGS